MTCIYLSSHHHKQYGEHIHHPCKFIIAPKKYLPAPSLLCAFLLLLNPQTTTDLLSVTIICIF